MILIIGKRFSSPNEKERKIRIIVLGNSTIFRKGKNLVASCPAIN
jgi:hypothetical protein